MPTTLFNFNSDNEDVMTLCSRTCSSIFLPLSSLFIFLSFSCYRNWRIPFRNFPWACTSEHFLQLLLDSSGFKIHLPDHRFQHFLLLFRLLSIAFTPYLLFQPLNLLSTFKRGAFSRKIFSLTVLSKTLYSYWKCDQRFIHFVFKFLF